MIFNMHTVFCLWNKGSDIFNMCTTLQKNSNQNTKIHLQLISSLVLLSIFFKSKLKQKNIFYKDMIKYVVIPVQMGSERHPIDTRLQCQTNMLTNVHAY